MNVNEWLTQNPDEICIAPAPHGGRHIPIEFLENLLDDCTGLNWSTQNFKFTTYLEQGELHCAGSIELVLNYELLGEKIKRTFCGGSNFRIFSILPNIDWVATLKSYCVKNAASDAGKKLGRDLNKSMPIISNGKKDKREDKLTRTINQLDVKKS